MPLPLPPALEWAGGDAAEAAGGGATGGAAAGGAGTGVGADFFTWPGAVERPEDWGGRDFFTCPGAVEWPDDDEFPDDEDLPGAGEAAGGGSGAGAGPAAGSGAAGAGGGTGESATGAGLGGVVGFGAGEATPRAGRPMPALPPDAHSTPAAAAEGPPFVPRAREGAATGAWRSGATYSSATGTPSLMRLSGWLGSGAGVSSGNPI